MEAQIDRYLEQFLHSVGEVGPKYLVSMGSDVRFAVQAIKQKPVVDQIVKLSTKELSKFADEVLKQSSESLVTKYHMSLPDAQSLGPSLLTHVMFAKALDVEKIAVANVNLRDGLIKEMTDNHQWTDSIQRQIVRSAMLLGRKYSFNEAHATHVASVACLLFDQLEVLHQLPRRWRGLLEIGALLHGIGLYISSRSRHKHSMYLINNSEMFGIGQQELQMIAMIARYFRGAPPQPSHPPYARLSRSNRVAISKLAAILRIAKALDVTHRQPFSKFECKLAPGEVEMFVDQSIDLSLEKLELKQTGGLFTSIFGRTPRLKSTRDEL
jgi:exopolyphosphatase/guanosine-5'-triphosphate,3'-diphosphate pyrophosphatase